MAAKVSNLNFEERKRREKVRIVYEVRFDEIFKIEDHYTYYDGKDNFVREQRNTSGGDATIRDIVQPIRPQISPFPLPTQRNI